MTLLLQFSLFVLSFIVIPFSSSVVFAKSIVVCVDGTGNHPDDANDHANDHDTTNVFRLSDALLSDDRQVVKYFPGVGTTGWTLIDAKGQWFGFGAKDLRENAYTFLENTYSPVDDIFIFGFSRGAAIVRDLANRIHDDGLGSHQGVPIAFLGLWDTVAAFGVPIDILGLPTQSINFGKKLDVPPNVKQTYHLLAIDEQRTPFIPTLIEKESTIEEIWFAGTHADVGGGFHARRLADISLQFMVARAQQNGLRFNEEVLARIPQNLKGEGTLHANGKDLPLALRKIVVRKHNQESMLFPNIHRSVIERMKTDEYQPPNIQQLNGAYKIVD